MSKAKFGDIILHQPSGKFFQARCFRYSVSNGFHDFAVQLWRSDYFGSGNEIHEYKVPCGSGHHQGEFDLPPGYHVVTIEQILSSLEEIEKETRAAMEFFDQEDKAKVVKS